MVFFGNFLRSAEFFWKPTSRLTLWDSQASHWGQVLTIAPKRASNSSPKPLFIQKKQEHNTKNKSQHKKQPLTKKITSTLPLLPLRNTLLLPARRDSLSRQLLLHVGGQVQEESTLVILERLGGLDEEDTRSENEDWKVETLGSFLKKKLRLTVNYGFLGEWKLIMVGFVL